jgi:4a-hydroxytetrahydrobiopterin dehydratase
LGESLKRASEAIRFISMKLILIFQRSSIPNHRKSPFASKGGIMATELAKRECVPCKGGVPPLKEKEINELYSQLGADWKVVDAHHLEKEFKFKNFRQALDFTNRVGELAEVQGHHPDIFLTWGKVKLTIWTHKIDGLTESDFVFAAKVEQL